MRDFIFMLTMANGNIKWARASAHDVDQAKQAVIRHAWKNYGAVKHCLDCSRVDRPRPWLEQSHN